MDLISTIQDLIRFKTITGNETEIKKAAEYIVNKFAGTNIKAEIFQSTASPVVFLAVAAVILANQSIHSIYLSPIFVIGFFL